MRKWSGIGVPRVLEVLRVPGVLGVLGVLAPVAARWLIGVGLGMSVVSCGPVIVADFNSAEPAARNSAIVKAAAGEDRSKIPDLVRMLDSDDPATRLLAIQALERMTGERLGYDPAGSVAGREAAAGRWVEWVEAHPEALTAGEKRPG